MNLQLVSAIPQFRTYCTNCGNYMDKEIYADLDGEAFKDYYCSICAARFRRVDINGTIYYHKNEEP